jgi:predicted dinucleotide-binding enzyme
MNLTIIGAGNMGRGLGTRLVAGGNKVTILDRDPEEARGSPRSCKGAPRRQRRVRCRRRPAER